MVENGIKQIGQQSSGMTCSALKVGNLTMARVMRCSGVRGIRTSSSLSAMLAVWQIFDAEDIVA